MDPGRVCTLLIFLLCPDSLTDYHLDDQFLCNRCTLKGVKPAEAFDKQTLHTYLHPLVRCKERIEDPVTPPLPSVEARLENLEERLAGIEQTLVLLQQNMVALLDPKLRDV